MFISYPYLFVLSNHLINAITFHSIFSSVLQSLPFFLSFSIFCRFSIAFYFSRILQLFHIILYISCFSLQLYSSGYLIHFLSAFLFQISFSYLFFHIPQSFSRILFHKVSNVVYLLSVASFFKNRSKYIGISLTLLRHKHFQHQTSISFH